jgi:hypothetical protein
LRSKAYIEGIVVSRSGALLHSSDALQEKLAWLMLPPCGQ